MKKALSFIMAFVLLFGCLLPVCGEEIEPEWQEEQGFEFYVVQTPDGPALSRVFYIEYPTDGTVYVPKTLGGVTLTPDKIFGYSFSDRCVRTFRVDTDNEQFTVVDGALYTKDGKTALVFPNQSYSAFFTVPDGTETLADSCFISSVANCIIIPDSVKTISEDAFWVYYGNLCIAANPGTAAEAFAVASDITFVSLGKDHAHKFFHMRTEPTCISDGRVLIQCPCGSIYSDEVLPADPDAHCYSWIEDKSYTDGWYYGPCIYCGKEPDEPDEPSDDVCTCTCACHLRAHTDQIRTYKDFFLYCTYIFRLFVWRVLGIRQYCECGERHY